MSGSSSIGEYGPQAGNPAGVNKDSGFVDVRGGRPLSLLIENEVVFETEGIFLRI